MGGSTILVYLKISIEYLNLLSIIMTSQQQPIDEKDMNRAIEAYKNNPDFLKRIFEGDTQKKVDKFLDQPMIAKLPFPYNPAGLPPNVYEAIQSQYGNKTFGPYDIDKKQTVIDYYKGQKPL